MNLLQRLALLHGPAVSSLRALLTALVMLSSMANAADISSSNQIVQDDPFTGFKFPKMLAGYTFQDRIQYPRVALGYGLHYAERSGATATIVIYDMNRSGIPDGTTDAGVLEQYKDIDASIAAMVNQGGYRGAQRLDTLPLLSKAWLQANHELITANGRRTYSYSFIRAQNGKYVKIRVTAPTSATYERLPLFLLSVSRAIGMMSGQGKPSE